MKKKHVVVQLDDYIMELSGILQSSATVESMIRKVMMAGRKKDFGKAKRIYAIYHSTPTYSFRQFWSIEIGPKLEKVAKLIKALDFFQVKYPAPSAEIKEALQNYRSSVARSREFFDPGFSREEKEN